MAQGAAPTADPTVKVSNPHADVDWATRGTFKDKVHTHTTQSNGNQAPLFVAGPDVTVDEDSGAYQTPPTPYHTAGAYVDATDSASAGTALATGFKTDDGNVCWLPGDPDTGGNRSNDGSLMNISDIVRGFTSPWAIGAISTVQFSHATPAAFTAHNKSRNNYHLIGDEIINDTAPEVVIGAGHPKWQNTYRYLGPQNNKSDDTNYTFLKNGGNGYTFRERQAGVTTAGADLIATAKLAGTTKLFGLYGGSDGYFEHPAPQGGLDGAGLGAFALSDTARENPSLADAATAALTVLAKYKDGLFLMVEGGDIDWANHPNQYPWMLGAMHQFDQAVRAGEAFVDRGGDDITWDNTLFIVTSDHGNSFMRLGGTTLSKGQLPPVDDNGIPTDGSILYGGRRAYNPTIYNSHTNELVTLAARGAGADGFTALPPWYAAGIIDNTQVFEYMKAVAKGGTVKHIVLWIGDGMQKAHEVAYSRYRFGTDNGVTWAGWPTQRVCATWDVTTYNTYRKSYTDPANPAVFPAPVFNQALFAANPALYAHIGYDVNRGGTKLEIYAADLDPVESAYFLGGWAGAIFAPEPGQRVTFAVVADNPALFSGQPAIGTEGILTFTPAANASGNTAVTVTAHDDGGTANGGVDTSAPQTFTIKIVAQAFNVTAKTAQMNEGAGSVSVNDILADATDGYGHPATGTVIGVTQPTAGQGTVTFTNSSVTYTVPHADFTGQVQFSYTVEDDEGTQGTNTVTVRVAAINHP